MTTLLYKSAVGNFDNFISTPQAEDTKNNLTIYTRENKVSIPVDFQVWSKEVYRILLRRYRNWEIAYINVDDFLDSLWERIEIHTPNFYIRKAFYENLLTLSDKELLSQGQSIHNFVEHTDDVVDDPLDNVLKNITNQSADKAFSDYPSRLRSLISSAQYTLIEDYCKKFKSLFLKIYMGERYYG